MLPSTYPSTSKMWLAVIRDLPKQVNQVGCVSCGYFLSGDSLDDILADNQYQVFCTLPLPRCVQQNFKSVFASTKALMAEGKKTQLHLIPPEVSQRLIDLLNPRPKKLSSVFMVLRIFADGCVVAEPFIVHESTRKKRLCDVQGLVFGVPNSKTVVLPLD